MTDYTYRRTMMVDTQIRPSDVTKFPIIDAMLSTSREVFMPAELRPAAYIGEALDIGGRVIPEPRTFAKMLDAVNVQPDETVLDIACGLGYSVAVLARIGGFVVGVEDDDARADEAQSLLSQNGVDNAVIVSADLASGAPKSGPYDVIMIEGGVEHVPAAILDQLKDGGRMIACFVDGNFGVVRIGYKRGAGMDWRDIFNAGADILTGYKRESVFSL